MDAEQRDPPTPSPGAEPAIAALPLDLFGEPSGPPLAAPPAAPPAASTSPEPPVPIAPPASTASPVPQPLRAPAPAAATLPATPLSRLYDGLGVLLLFVVLGIFLGAFTWRVLWLVPLSAVIYFWPLRRFRARWHARLDS